MKKSPVRGRFFLYVLRDKKVCFGQKFSRVFITAGISAYNLIFPHYIYNIINGHFYNSPFTFNNSCHNNLQNILRQKVKKLLTNQLYSVEIFFQILKQKEKPPFYGGFLLLELIILRHQAGNQERRTYLRFLPKSQTVYVLDFFEQQHVFCPRVLFLRLHL